MRKAAVVELDKTAEYQRADIPIHLVIEIEQRVDPNRRANQRFDVSASNDRLIQRFFTGNRRLFLA